MASNYILCIYPIVLVILLLFGAKIAPKGTVYEDFFSLKTAKVLQGGSAVGIILHHLVQEVTSYGAVWKGPITHMNWMGVLFTSVFFFSSGYGLLKSYETKTDYLECFLERRMPAVLIPFLVSNVIYFIFIGIYTGRITRVTDAITCLFGFTLINTNTWFLVEIMIFYMAFYVLYKYIKDTGHALGAMTGVVLLTIVISLFLGHDNSELNGHWFMGEWWYNSSIVFVFGMLVAKYEREILRIAKKHYMWLLPVAILVFVGMYILSENIVENVGYYCEWDGYQGYKEKAITAFVQSMTCILFMMMIVLICMKVKFYNIIMDFVGKISLALYIIHDLIKQNVLNMYEEISEPVFFLIVFVYSFVMASILHFLVNTKLIECWMDYREKCEQEPQTLEAKQRWQKRKERRKKLKVWFVLISIVLACLVVKEAYEKYVVPRLNYEEQVAVLTTAQIGDTVYYGTFNIESSIKRERIEWRVLDKKDGRVLLVAVNGLHGAAFQQEYRASNWKDSTIRDLLNEEFLNMAFSEKEQELIAVTQVVTNDNSQYGTAGGNITYDKVFLLSAEEAQKYFIDDEARKLEPTTMAFRRGINVNPRVGSSWWWLRTMGKESNMVAVVSQDGEINLEGERVNIASGGIRPAIWIDMQ
ncbi:MAG: acyltransferase [Lachnospiraceae bacterium]|nr:acyltransferase [Lachnospiraceae bacterium]